jgi:hypothetical protein
MASGVVMLLDVVATLGGGRVPTLEHGATTLGVGASTVGGFVCCPAMSEFLDGSDVLDFVSGQFWYITPKSDIHHHSLTWLIHWHGHGSLLAVGAVGQWHSAILCGRGWLLSSRASRRVVGIGQTLLRALLLLRVTIGWSVAKSQVQDGLVHSSN